MDEMDDAVIMTDLRNVQRLADWSDGEISGYEIFTSDLAGADDFARQARTDPALRRCRRYGEPRRE